MVGLLTMYAVIAVAFPGLALMAFSGGDPAMTILGLTLFIGEIIWLCVRKNNQADKRMEKDNKNEARLLEEYGVIEYTQKD